MKKAALFIMVGLLLFSACKSDDDNDTGLLAYCAVFGGLSIVDITDPERPIETAFLDLGDSGMGVAFSSHYVYFLCYNQALMRIVDVDDRDNPVLVGSCDLPEAGIEVVVSESGYYAYVACDHYGLQVIDISVPAAPSVVGSVDTPDYANGVLVEGNLVYLADASSGLYIIDVSEPHSPVILGNTLSGSSVNSVTKSGNLVWLATTGRPPSYYGGVHTVDVSNPSAPEELSYEQYVDCVDVYYSNGEIYLISWGATFENPGLYILSASDDPYLYGEYREWSFSGHEMIVRNDIAYVATTHGLQIFNVSNPLAITELSTIDLPNGARDLAIGRR